MNTPEPNYSHVDLEAPVDGWTVKALVIGAIVAVVVVAGWMLVGG